MKKQKEVHTFGVDFFIICKEMIERELLYQTIKVAIRGMWSDG